MPHPGDLHTIQNPTQDIEKLLSDQAAILYDRETELSDIVKNLNEINNKPALKQRIEILSNTIAEIDSDIERKEESIKITERYLEHFKTDPLKYQDRLEEIPSKIAKIQKEIEILKEDKRKKETEKEKLVEILERNLTPEEVETLREAKLDLIHTIVMAQLVDTIDAYVLGLKKILFENQEVYKQQDRKIKAGLVYFFNALRPIIGSINLLSGTNKSNPVFSVNQVYPKEFTPLRGKGRLSTREKFEGSGIFYVTKRSQQGIIKDFDIKIHTRPVADEKGQARVSIILQDKNFPYKNQSQYPYEICLRVDLVPNNWDQKGQAIGWKIEIDIEFPGIKLIFPGGNSTKWKSDPKLVSLVNSLYSNFLGSGDSSYHRPIKEIDDPRIFEAFVNRCAYNLVNSEGYTN